MGRVVPVSARARKAWNPGDPLELLRGQPDVVQEPSVQLSCADSHVVGGCGDRAPRPEQTGRGDHEFVGASSPAVGDVQQGFHQQPLPRLDIPGPAQPHDQMAMELVPELV